jgi:hypothetical protein
MSIVTMDDMMYNRRHDRPNPIARNRYSTPEKESAIHELKRFMIDHEGDIACGVNDFDTLRDSFETLIGRAAQTDAK